MRIVYLLLTILTAAPAVARAELMIEGGWVRMPPPNARSVAAYGTLVNGGDEPLTVADVRSPAFAMGMLHRTVIEDGISRMVHLGAVSLAPGERFELAPGGAHVMLMRPEGPVAEGSTIAIELLVRRGTSDGPDDGRWQVFELPVRRP